MSDQNQKIVKTEQTSVDENGAVVRERAQSVHTNVNSKVTIANIVWYIFGFISIILSLRFVLKLFGANSGNDFVGFIYDVSGVLSGPFDTIFGVTKSTSGQTNSVFEPSILVAIGVYALIAWGVTKLLTVNEPK